MGEPELKYYTVCQVRDWLLHCIDVDGLSEKMIARQRAWAIVNNPYVKDEDAILSVIVVDGVVAAYTACFPEILGGEQRRIWWLTTLSCKKEFAGRGFGLIVVGQLIELHQGEQVLDMDGAEETIEICRMLGMKEQYKTCYRFRSKAYSDNLKGKIAAKIHCFKGTIRRTRSLCKFPLRQSSFALRYIAFLDDETYDFIRKYSGDTFPRSRQMINWILMYPFMQSSPLHHRVETELEFTSNIAYYEYRLVQVWSNDMIVGLFAFRNCPWGMSVKCVYYANEKSKIIVHQAIAEHIFHLNPKTFDTFDECLARQVEDCGLFDVCDEITKSFSYPRDWERTDVERIQAWDGDMFV